MELNSLTSAAIVVVTLIVVLAFGALIVTNIGSGFTAGTAAKNITDVGLNSMKSFGSYLPTIVAVIIGVLIIGLLVGGFMAYRR